MHPGDSTSIKYRRLDQIPKVGFVTPEQGVRVLFTRHEVLTLIEFVISQTKHLRSLTNRGRINYNLIGALTNDELFEILDDITALLRQALVTGSANSLEAEKSD